MYYTIYKITNKITGKIYIGSHKTSNVNDGYMGSGTYLTRAYKKYGSNSFSKEILFIFENSTEMYAKEAEIVNSDFLENQNTFNLKLGGHGGFDHINSDKTLKSEYCRTSGKVGGPACWEMIKNDPQKLEAHRLRSSNSIKTAKINGNLKPPPLFTGKTHSSVTKKKMSDAKQNKYTGKHNSQYNTCWVYSLIERKSIKISNAELEHYTSAGWIKGRKMSFNISND